MMIELVLCVIFLATICISDIKEYKIRNRVVLPMLAAGILLAVVRGDLADSLCGMALPLILLPLYGLKMLGAGDIKALCALGVLLGPADTVRLLIFCLLGGAVLAAILLLLRGDACERIANLRRYFWQCVAWQGVQPYNFGGRGGGFRFAFAIVLGVLLVYANKYWHWI